MRDRAVHEALALEHALATERGRAHLGDARQCALGVRPNVEQLELPALELRFQLGCAEGFYARRLVRVVDLEAAARTVHEIDTEAVRAARALRVEPERQAGHHDL